MVMRIGQLRRMLLHAGLLALFAFLVLPTNAENQKITKMTVPRFVENGTDESIVLDCEYECTDSDIRLVVKWFINDNPEPIYQWIPELNIRIVTPIYESRVDMKFEIAPSDNCTRFRAISFIRPTTEMTGRYTCDVTSMGSHGSSNALMTVYSTARRIEFDHVTDDDVVNLTCEVDGIYPFPEIQLYQMGPEDTTPSLVEEIEIHKYDEGFVYRVVLTTEIPVEELSSSGMTFFDCQISLPGTKYRTKKRVAYIPGAKAAAVEVTPTSNNNSNTICPVSLMVMVISRVLAHLIW